MNSVPCIADLGPFRLVLNDLGANPAQVLLRVVVPSTLPGILSAIEIVFAIFRLCLRDTLPFGRWTRPDTSTVIYDNIGSLDWVLAAVQSLTLLGITVLVLFGLRRLGRYEGTTNFSGFHIP
ncbi:hypothetical protein FS799_16320 [Agrobacterium vitis]|uniref:hypothetical protein n=1 Tax=Agrobacterium vitis TaxID=373 RepID=UPI001F2C3F54|nr:hypothetical protein [Agrobacterium vitis]MCE6076434.1 hypothetical protein [Agrobacterium vitis]